MFNFHCCWQQRNILTTKISWSMVEYPDYKILLIPTTQSSHVVREWHELRCEVINNGVCILHVLPLSPALTQVALQLEASWKKQSDMSCNNGLLATFPDRRGNQKATVGVNPHGIFTSNSLYTLQEAQIKVWVGWFRFNRGLDHTWIIYELFPLKFSG